MTGFPVFGFIVLGLAVIVLGLALVRFASVRRPGHEHEARRKVISIQ
jgi:hypothetical protein